MQELDLGSCTYVADVQRGLHVGPITIGVGTSLIQSLLPASGSLSPAELPCLSSGGEDALVLMQFGCARAGCPFSEEERRRD